MAYLLKHDLYCRCIYCLKNQYVNHDFVSHEQQITGDSELTQLIESEPKNGLEIIPHIPRMGGLRKKAVLVNRDVKESPLSITSGLLYRGGTNS
jgi:predicted heme/steroid binding protein